LFLGSQETAAGLELMKSAGAVMLSIGA